MKKLLFLFLITGFNSYCQSPNRILFRYDSAGNQDQRSLCINCSISRIANDSIIKEEDLISEEEIDHENSQSLVKYHPNPVLEELNVSWINDTQSKLQKIDVYSLNGQLLTSYRLNNNQDSITIPFNRYAEGYYNLILIYSNNDRKTIKIVKVKN